MQRRIGVFKEFISSLASLSKCTERQVAAIITNSALTQIYSIGINGGAAGLDDCLCITDGKYGCVHAEINALSKCTSTDPAKVMFVTLSPCKQCAAAIINSGIKTLFYIEGWKDDSGIRLLERGQVNCIRL